MLRGLLPLIMLCNKGKLQTLISLVSKVYKYSWKHLSFQCLKKTKLNFSKMIFQNNFISFYFTKVDTWYLAAYPPRMYWLTHTQRSGIGEENFPQISFLYIVASTGAVTGYLRSYSSKYSETFL